MTREELLLDLDLTLKVGELYDLEFAIPPNFPTELNMFFRYMGKVGNGNLYNFRSVPGDFSVSFSANQLFNRVFLPGTKPRKNAKKKKTQKNER